MNKFAPAIALILLSTPVFAQSGASSSPPSPNASSSAPEPANSLPPGAANMNIGSSSNPNVGGALGSTAVTPGASPAPMSAAPTAQQPMANTVPVPASR